LKKPHGFFAAKVVNIYSDSIDEKVTIACFLFCYDIAPPPPSKKTYLKVDL
jgi:hypothetical protein